MAQPMLPAEGVGGLDTLSGETAILSRGREHEEPVTAAIIALGLVAAIPRADLLGQEAPARRYAATRGYARREIEPATRRVHRLRLVTDGTSYGTGTLDIAVRSVPWFRTMVAASLDAPPLQVPR